MYNNSIDFHYNINIPQYSEAICIFPCLKGFCDYLHASLNRWLAISYMKYRHIILLSD